LGCNPDDNAQLRVRKRRFGFRVYWD
jgi:hypothetical protein